MATGEKRDILKVATSCLIRRVISRRLNELGLSLFSQYVLRVFAQTATSHHCEDTARGNESSLTLRCVGNNAPETAVLIVYRTGVIRD